MEKMEVKKCLTCGVTCWHNPCGNKDRVGGRCTFCGSPPNGNNDSNKRAHGVAMVKTQSSRASLLGITRAGKW